MSIKFNLKQAVVSIIAVVFLTASSCTASCPTGSHYEDSNNPSYSSTGMCISDANGSFVAVPTDWVDEGHKDTVVPGTEGGDPIANKTQEWGQKYGSNPVQNTNNGLTSAGANSSEIQQGAKVACSVLSHDDNRWITGDCERGK